MRTNHMWGIRMIRTFAILTCILLPLSGIAADLSVNEQLLNAVGKGSLEQVKTLLEKGGDPNVKDSYGWPVLMKAVMWWRFDMVKLLVNKGADVNAKDWNGGTMLMAAAKYGKARYR